MSCHGIFQPGAQRGPVEIGPRAGAGMALSAIVPSVWAPRGRCLCRHPPRPSMRTGGLFAGRHFERKCAGWFATPEADRARPVTLLALRFLVLTAASGRACGRPPGW